MKHKNIHIKLNKNYNDLVSSCQVLPQMSYEDNFGFQTFLKLGIVVL